VSAHSERFPGSIDRHILTGWSNIEIIRVFRVFPWLLMAQSISFSVYLCVLCGRSSKKQINNLLFYRLFLLGVGTQSGLGYSVVNYSLIMVDRCVDLLQCLQWVGMPGDRSTNHQITGAHRHCLSRCHDALLVIERCTCRAYAGCHQ